MGQLRNKLVSHARTWIDPQNPTPLPTWDYDIVYPISVYEAIHRDMDDDSTTLDVELENIYRLINGKQNIIEGGTPGRLMTWTNIRGTIGETELLRYINSDPNARSFSKVPSEKAVGLALDLKADAADINEHVHNTGIHITEEERDKWNGMTPRTLFNTHANNIDIHITPEERVAWNNKANQSDFTDHLEDNNNPHNVSAHQTGTYNRQEIDNMFETIKESFFSYMNIYYDERSGQGDLVEYASENWNPNYVLQYRDELPEVSDKSLTHFALRPITDYTTNETQVCAVYIRKPGNTTTWTEINQHTMQTGDLVIRYPDTTMFVWIAGRFKTIFSSSSAAGDGSGTDDNLMWRPVYHDGYLGWTLSSEDDAPDEVYIKGAAGEKPVKGVDYFDGAPGIGVPAGGNPGDIIIKTNNEDYETEWKSLSELFGSSESGVTIIWENISGRPTIYQTTGNDTKGVMSQKAVTDELNGINTALDGIRSQIGSTSGLAGIRSDLDAHIRNYNNPHRVSAASIGAVPNSSFIEHTQNFDNPHAVTAAQLGLGNVNNTSDLEKPISRPTQAALDELRNALNTLSSTLDTGRLVSNVVWDDSSCTLTFTFRDNSELEVVLPIIETFNSIYYDNTSNDLVIVLPDGSEHRIEVQSLITVYEGSEGPHITVTVQNGVIRATIVPGSITGNEIAESVALRGAPTIATPLVTENSNVLATTKFVHDQVIDNLISYDATRPLSANMGRILNQNKLDLEDVLAIIADTPLLNVIDNLISTEKYSALSANMGRELNLTKAPWVHTSPSGSTYGRATVSLYGHARASDVDPLMDGTPSIGTDNGYYARADHRHPTDISRAPVNWPDVDNGIYKFTGTPRAETPDNDEYGDRIATTEWVIQNGVDIISDEWIIDAIDRAHAAVLMNG